MKNYKLSKNDSPVNLKIKLIATELFSTPFK